MCNTGTVYRTVRVSSTLYLYMLIQGGMADKSIFYVIDSEPIRPAGIENMGSWHYFKLVDKIA